MCRRLGFRLCWDRRLLKCLPGRVVVFAVRERVTASGVDGARLQVSSQNLLLITNKLEGRGAIIVPLGRVEVAAAAGDD
jgi:hypothetical protein